MTSQWGSKQDRREPDLFGEPDRGKPVESTQEQPSLFEQLTSPRVADEGKEDGNNKSPEYDRP